MKLIVLLAKWIRCIILKCLGYTNTFENNIFFKWGFISKKNFGFGIIIARLCEEYIDPPNLVTKQHIYLNIFLCNYSFHIRLPNEVESKERITVFLSCIYIVSLKKFEFVVNNQLKQTLFTWS